MGKNMSEFKVRRTSVGMAQQRGITEFGKDQSQKVNEITEKVKLSFLLLLKNQMLWKPRSLQFLD